MNYLYSIIHAAKGTIISVNLKSCIKKDRAAALEFELSDIASLSLLKKYIQQPDHKTDQGSQIYHCI